MMRRCIREWTVALAGKEAEWKWTETKAEDQGEG